MIGAVLVAIGDGLPAYADQEQAQAKAIIRSGAEIDYPPFSIVDPDGHATGFAVELMRAALAAMGRGVTFRTGPWKDVRAWLERGEIDALPLVGRTPEREAFFDFTVPYMSLHGAIAVRKGTADIRNLDDLEGRQVAVMKGDNAEEFLRREDRGFAIITTDTFDKALRELSGGKYDAVVTQRLVALRLINEAGLTNLEVINQPIEGFRQDFCFAVREGDRDTLALLNEGLAIVMADGTHRHLHAKWFAALQLPTDRRIVIGGDHNFPPFEYLDEKDRPAGFNVELTRAIAQEMGLDIEIHLSSWTRILQGLEDGTIDAVQGMFYSHVRDLAFDFSQTHMVSHYVSVARRDDGPPPETLEALKDRRIVVQQGDIAHDYLEKNLPEGGVAVVDAQEDALRAVAEGQADVALVARLSALYWIDKNGWTNLKAGHTPILSPEYCYAVPSGRKALLAQLGEGLKILEESGEYRRIREKWMGVYADEPPTFLEALQTLMLILIAFLAVFAVVVFWSWSLRRQVARKTRALQESIDKFKFVFESANVGKSLTLPTGEVNANQAFADLLGYTREELQGKSWQDLTPAKDIEAIQRRIDPLLKGDQDSIRFEKRYIHKDGHIVWADVSAAIRRDHKGRPIHFVTNVVDITARKRAEQETRESEKRFRRAVEEAPFPIMIHAEDGEVLTVSRAWEDITGYGRQELPTMADWTALAYGDNHQSIREIIATTYGLEGPKSEGEFDVACKDGSQRVWSFSSTPLGRLPDGRRIVISMAADLTEHKQTEERLRHLTMVLRALRKINQVITQVKNQHQLLHCACDILTETRGYHSAWICLRSATGAITAVAESGIGEAFGTVREDLAHGRLPACCRMIQDGVDIAVIPRTDVNCTMCSLACLNEDAAALAGPLRHGDHDYGVIVVSLPVTVANDKEEQALFQEIANDIAFALQDIEVVQAREKMAEALAASEKQYRLLADNTLDTIWTMSPDLTFTYVNPAIQDLTGYTPEEWIGSRLSDHCDESRLLEMASVIQEEIARGRDHQGVVFETVMRRRDGSDIPVEIHGKIIFDEMVNPVMLQGVTRDISERKNAEAALRRSEHHLKTLVNTIPDLVWLKDAAGVYLSCNPTFERFFGAKESEIVGKTDYDFVEPELADFFREHDRKAMAAGRPSVNEETLTFATDGYLGTFETVKMPMVDIDGELVGVLGIARDVSERKRTQAELEWNLRRNQLLSKTAARLLQSSDPQRVVEDVCTEVMQFIDGQAFFNFLTDAQSDRMHLNAYAGIPEEAAREIEWLEYGVAVCGCVARDRQRIICEDIQGTDDPTTDLIKSFGIQAYCCHPLMIQEGLLGTLSFGSRTKARFSPEEIELMASIADLVAVAMNRMEVEKNLDEKNQFTQTILDNLPIGLAVNYIDKGDTTYINRKFEEIYGWPKEELGSAEEFFNKVYPDEGYREQVKRRINSDIQSGEPSRMVWEGIEATGRDGRKRIVMAKNIPLYDQGLMISTVQDITESRNLQEQLIQAQKLESVGRLAGGVAHDFNNILSVIIGYAELAVDDLDPGDPLSADLKEIINAAKRSRNITRQLLAFARKETIAPEVLNLNETIENLLKMLRRLIGEDIELAWYPAPELWPVKMDPSQVDQILANLCINARDAIQDVGKVTIETRNVIIDAAYGADHPEFKLGDFVMLAVSDDGCGMDRETVGKIFEPFFTTKGMGRGTGLGLATIYGIVKQNEGFINVYSEPDKGTSFRIYLSRHAGDKRDQQHAPVEATVSGHGETVLVVEDDPAILKLTARILAPLDYTVLEARRPREAVALSETHEGDIHLLVTDVVMPDMNGRELSDTIEKLHPEMKTLFMSGYTANVIAHRGVLDADVHFLHKPFSKQQLAAKVREALEDENPAD